MLEHTEVAVAVRRTPRDALRTALRSLSAPLPLGEDSAQVVIKPSIYDPKLPGNTSLEMTKAIVEVFKGVGRLYVVESDNPVRDADEAFRATGYDSLQDLGAELLNLSESPMREVQMPGNFFTTRKMPEVLHKKGVFVNLATMKREPSVSAIGASIKNLFGLLPERDKSAYHSEIDSILVDLLATYRPDLTVIDLTAPVIGRREDGISKHLGGIVVGLDSVAVDSLCADLLGVDPLAVPHLRKVYDLGMGEALLDRIMVRGTDHQKSTLFSFFR